MFDQASHNDKIKASKFDLVDSDNDVEDLLANCSD